MKIFTIILTLIFTMNTFASSMSVGALELEKAFDEYQFAITVEWDQKDSKFYDEQTEALFGKLTTLMQEHGLKKEDILSFTEKKSNSTKELEALKLKFNLLPSTATPKELVQVLKSNSQSLYSRGASWNGEILVQKLFGVVIVAFLLHAIWFSATHECTEYRDGDLICKNEIIGSGTDSLGNTFYIYSTYETCEYERVCANWVKK